MGLILRYIYISRFTWTRAKYIDSRGERVEAGQYCWTVYISKELDAFKSPILFLHRIRLVRGRSQNPNSRAWIYNLSISIILVSIL